jgi:hypothetical protein
MSVKAKGRATLRIIGSLIILVGLFLTISFNIVLVNNIIGNLIIIVILIPWMLFSIMLKLELNFFINNTKKVAIGLTTYSVSVVFISIILSCSIFAIIIIITSLNLLLLLCWHFSLSIYKLKKLIFLVSGLGYIIGTFCMNLQIISTINHSIVFNLIFIFIGLILILGIEYHLRKIGYLNYI